MVVKVSKGFLQNDFSIAGASNQMLRRRPRTFGLTTLLHHIEYILYAVYIRSK